MIYTLYCVLYYDMTPKKVKKKVSCTVCNVNSNFDKNKKAWN